MLIDYSSAFNTIAPSMRGTKLRTLDLNTSFFNWILDFLIGQPHNLCHTPIHIDGAAVEQVESFKILMSKSLNT